MESPATRPKHVVLVTGPSGAGRSTALHALEDLGFEAIDNIPLSLVARLLESAAPDRPIALGLDIRNRDFSPEALADLRASLDRRPDVAAELLFLDCRPEVLVRRFSATRRRHPLAALGEPEAAVRAELQLVAPVREAAGHLIDTSDLAPHELSDEIRRRFAGETGEGLKLAVLSFSYRRGLPHAADVVFDCRFLRNPHWEPELRALTGLDPAVAAHVERDPRLAGFLERVLALLLFQLPACTEEGKASFTLAFGCTGGRHRSVVVAERVAARLSAAGWPGVLKHRELSADAATGGGTRKPGVTP